MSKLIAKNINEKNWNSYWTSRRSNLFTKESWSKRRMLKILDRYVEPGKTVLDAGSGCGFFSNYFIKKGLRVYCLDYSKDALDLTKEATQKKAEKYLEFDLTDPKLPEKLKVRFDYIFSDGLLEHFPKKEQEKILKNFNKVKKEKGIIFAFVPNKYSLWEIIRPIFMPQIVEDPFDSKRLSNLFDNFKVIEEGGINVLPIKVSPEFWGRYWGMLRYIICR